MTMQDYIFSFQNNLNNTKLCYPRLPWMKFTVLLKWGMFTSWRLHVSHLSLGNPRGAPFIGHTVVSAIETYLFFPLSAWLLCWDQGFVVWAALCCEVDFGQSVFYQCHGQVHALNVQPANEVPGFVHALHLNFHLEDKWERRKRSVNEML